MIGTPLSRARRFAVAGVVLLLSAVAFRSQLADALVSRGDEALVRGAQNAALRYYARALYADPRSATAADRYVFAQFERHSAPGYAQCISGATRYLSVVPGDARVLRDRALCRLRLREFERARADFDAAFARLRDPQDAVFAGWAALRAGDRDGARRRWVRALRAQPANLPARIALSRHP